MADRQDFATRVGQLIKGRSPVGHTHAWGDITSKPTTFTPAAHSHVIGDVTGLQARLAALEKVWQTDIPLTTDWRTDVQTEVKAYRNGNVVTVAAWRLATKVAMTGDVTAYTLPPGYRPAGLTQQYIRDGRDAKVALLYTGQVVVTNPATSVAHHSFTFVTLDPPPTS